MASNFPVTRSPKPSCSYHCMIGMALLASPSGKLPVNEIYKYILSRFPYFKTAADNWKNSVRHCLSLGQCFHKVTHPGTFHFKKGFHWQVVPHKHSVVYQEIFKYLATTGQKAENYGISTSTLGAGLQVPPMPPPCSSSGLSPGPLLSPLQMKPNIPDMSNAVEIQLNQSDLESLHMLGQTTNLSLSPFDYNLLMNPNMQQELQKLVTLLGFSNVPSQQNPRQPTISSNIVDSFTTPPKQIISTARTPVTSLCSAVNDCLRITSSTPPSYISTASSRTTPSTSVLPVVPSTPGISTNFNTKGVVIRPISRDELNTGIEYCLNSPPAFITRYPSTIELVQSDVVTEEDEEQIYPFINDSCGEDGDISLSQLNGIDHEDSEEPLMFLNKSRSGSHHSFSIDPVNGDWNCWGEPDYIDRINTLVNSTFTKDEAAVLSKPLDNIYKNSRKSGERAVQKRKTENCGKQTKRNTVGSKVKKQLSKPLIVSIPFLKLLTSRQAKKYCQS